MNISTIMILAAGLRKENEAIYKENSKTINKN